MKGVTICSKCRQPKKDNGNGYCPECNLGLTRSKDGVITRIYLSQKASSKTRGHRPPEYSKRDLKDWILSQTLFHELYDEWVQSNYKKALKPSVDRKHDDLHYCMKNIQLMTWGDNQTKEIKYQSFTIEVFLYGKTKGKFTSLNQAGKQLKNISYASLGCCLKDGTSTNGYTVERISNDCS